MYVMDNTFCFVLFFPGCSDLIPISILSELPSREVLAGGNALLLTRNANRVRFSLCPPTAARLGQFGTPPWTRRGRAGQRQWPHSAPLASASRSPSSCPGTAALNPGPPASCHFSGTQTTFQSWPCHYKKPRVSL